MSVFKKFLTGVIFAAGSCVPALAENTEGKNLTTSVPDSKICQSMVKDYNTLTKAAEDIDEVSYSSYSLTGMPHALTSEVSSEVYKRQEAIKVAVGLACSDETISNLGKPVNNEVVFEKAFGSKDTDLEMCQNISNDYNALINASESINVLDRGGLSFKGVPFGTLSKLSDDISNRRKILSEMSSVVCLGNN